MHVYIYTEYMEVEYYYCISLPFSPCVGLNGTLDSAEVSPAVCIICRCCVRLCGSSEQPRDSRCGSPERVEVCTAS